MNTLPHLTQRDWQRMFGDLQESMRRPSYRWLAGGCWIIPRDGNWCERTDRANLPPGCDHTSMWRLRGNGRGGAHPAEVMVTQPYSYELDDMVAFAREHGLWFWVSEQPAWHNPGRVFFIEWASPKSAFSKCRTDACADSWMRTIHSWRGKKLISGPGSLTNILHQDTLKSAMNWIKTREPHRVLEAAAYSEALGLNI
jgi:hypothetical protein